MIWLVSVQMGNNLLLLLACNFTPAGGETHYKVEVIANHSGLHSLSDKPSHSSHSLYFIPIFS